MYCAIQPRGSITLGIRRWLIRRCLTTTSEDLERGIRAIFIANGPVHADVVRCILVDLRRAGLCGLFGIDHNRQGLVIHFDQSECILRRIAVIGDDDSHARAGMCDTIDLQHARRIDVILDTSRLRLPRAGECWQILEILAGEHRDQRRNVSQPFWC